jgi:hypothetical protein
MPRRPPTHFLRRFVHEPLDDWADGQELRSALARTLATLAVVFVVAATFFVAHVALTTP